MTSTSTHSRMTASTLHPVYDSRKSFYGKAMVTTTTTPDGSTHINLRSYDTLVASIDNGSPRIRGFYSATTTRHIKEFLLQHGFEATTKAQMLKDYVRN